MKYVYSFLLLISLAGFMSCATIFTKSAYPITFTTQPESAYFSITNRAGKVIYTGSTPTTVKLKASAGYMKKEEYIVMLQKIGYEPKTISVVCKLDGWYVANILIGGLIGMLIVDPASGAMYKFDNKNIETTLESNGSNSTEMELQIIDINDLPKDVQEGELVQIN